MADVAQLAGVSKMTVSHVMNGHRHVRPETRAKVEAAMAELDYRPNVTARALRRGRTGVLGLAVSNINMTYSAELARAVIEEAAKHGYRVAVEETRGRPEAEADAWLRSPLTYDGLLISTSALHRVPRGTLPHGYPVVALGESMEDPAVDHVAMDNDGGLGLATRHLLGLGRRRVAFVGGSLAGGTGMVVHRTQGYVETLAAAGIDVDASLVVPCSSGLDGGRAAAAAVLSARADGAVCVTDTVAIGLLRGLADAGVRVPGDIPVVGFDNVKPASYAVPSLTTVDPNVGELVSAAMGMLLERMSGFDGPGRLHVGRCVLVTRESTAL